MAATRKSVKYADLLASFIFRPTVFERLSPMNTSALNLLNDLGRKISSMSGYRDDREGCFLFSVSVCRSVYIYSVIMLSCCTKVSLWVMAWTSHSSMVYNYLFLTLWLRCKVQSFNNNNNNNNNNNILISIPPQVVTSEVVEELRSDVWHSREDRSYAVHPTVQTIFLYHNWSAVKRCYRSHCLHVCTWLLE